MGWMNEIMTKSRTPHGMQRYSVLIKTFGCITMLKCLIWSHLAQFCSDSKIQFAHLEHVLELGEK